MKRGGIMTQQNLAPEGVPVDTNADGVADAVVFDLDEDSVPDTVVVDTDGDAVADAVVFDLDEDAAVQPAGPVDEPGALEDDPMYTPPDDITQDDVEQAQDDLGHTELMNDYMMSRGVIDY
jgi:hypothetical protein